MAGVNGSADKPGGQADDGPRHRSGTLVYASRNNTKPNPPFLCNGVNFAYHSFNIDPERVAPFLPPGIVLTGEQIGFTAMCVIGDAWSLGAFDWSFGGVIVDHYESPDGSEGALVLFSYVSPAASPVFTETYEAGSIAGPTRVEDDAGVWWATTGPAGAPPHLRIGSKVTSEPVVIDGIDRYLSHDGAGHLVDWTVSYVGTARMGDIVAFEIGEDAPPGLKAMAPTRTHWGARNTDFRCSFSAPHLVRVAGDAVGLAAESAFLGLLGTHPSAAVVLDADLRVRHMNAGARALIGRAVSRTQGYLRAPDVVAQHRLETVVVEAVAGSGERGPFRLELHDLEPLIAEAFILDPQVFGAGKVLLLVTDPRAPAPRDAGPSLRLLGLTEAEARIAAQVGSGSSPQEAAAQLRLAVGTVRSTLKSVYDKLGVRRQAELARLVTRLGGA